MKRLPPRHRWLIELTSLATTSGREHRVVGWVRRWAGRRPDVIVASDPAGNLLLRLRGRRRTDHVVAVAHMDHPGFVVEAIDRRQVHARFMGGVMPQYFPGAAVELFDASDRRSSASVVSYEAKSKTALLNIGRRGGDHAVGDVGRWRFGSNRLGVFSGQLHAPACDDLAGVAAALAALDEARRHPESPSFSVLLTRAEEQGFIGAIAACKAEFIPRDAFVLSVEASRAGPESPIGGGPVVRVGDGSSVFDHELTNTVAGLAGRAGLKHQRRLMSGGSCEATAFGAYGYRATGLCLPLGNFHNMMDIDGVSAGQVDAVLAPEVISVEDFDGLVKLLRLAARTIESTEVTHERDLLRDSLDDLFAAGRHVLEA